MDCPMTLALHEEFAKRMQDEHARQNHRISELEKALEQYNKLLVSVEKLALNIEKMQEELHSQGNHIAEIENRDGEMWRKVVSHVVTAAVGAVMAFVFAQVGM